MKLTPLLTAHAVVQRHQTIPVWGWTQHPRALLRAQLGESQAEGISGDDCRFLLRLPELDAGGPYVLTVETLDGAERCVVSDILVGEVWLASGQSNMQWEMSASKYTEEIEASHVGQIRMINVGRRANLAPQSTVVGQWDLSSPGTTPAFSAIANFFGNQLQDELKIPVGIIHSSWGGSTIETWISRERLLCNMETRSWVETYESMAYSRLRWEDSKEKYLPMDPGNTGLEKRWHQPEFDDHDWTQMPLPSFWQNHGHNISAVMWFRKRVALPAHMRGKALSLHVGCVDKHDITYANGVEVGRMGDGFDESLHAQHRVYTVPADLTQDADLLVAVRVYSFMHGGGLTGPAEAMRVTVEGDDFGESVPLAGDWSYQIEHDFGFIELVAQGMGHGNHNSPYMLFENMIKPMLPVGIAGAIWYQGESNAGKPAAYRQLLRDLVEDWRHAFGVGDFPFGVVQLPDFSEAADLELEASWPTLREAQADLLELPNTGMAVTLGCGEADNIHPRDKKTVSAYLAQWALAKVYGRNLIASGALYSHHRVEGRRIRIFFRHVGSGLSIANGNSVQGLFICDAGGSYKLAQSAIEGQTLVVWHDDVVHPVAVRYAWSQNPASANLINGIGYPTGPFRTHRGI